MNVFCRNCAGDTVALIFGEISVRPKFYFALKIILAIIFVAFSIYLAFNVIGFVLLLDFAYRVLTAVD